MKEQISNLNIDYLRNGVYFDKLSTKDSSDYFQMRLQISIKKVYGIFKFTEII